MERKQVFTGIRKEAIDFLIGLRLNNNETYYKEHLDIYEKELRAPLRELNEAVTPVITGICPNLNVNYNVNWDLPYADAMMTPEGQIALARVYVSEQLSAFSACPGWFFQTWKTSGRLVGWDARVALATFERRMLD